MFEVVGNLSKMYVGDFPDSTLNSKSLTKYEPIYSLVLDNKKYNINNYLNQNKKYNITIEFLNNINCIYCNREIKKTFNQGYCFPCFRSLARCDSCIMSPEKCHYHLGTCREPKWGEQHCMQEHIVYLANSSGPKVGLTRHNQIPTRWIDQGAVQALIIARTKSRYHAGLLEVICKQFLADKTNWRAMLKNEVETIDLFQIRDDLLKKIETEFSTLQNSINHSIIECRNEKVVEICYPVKCYPSKIKSFNLDNSPIVSGELHGIKGQYIILDNGVINLRKYTGYKVKITLTEL